jgi:hypothetical protein
MIPSECECSRLAVEAAKVVPGRLLDTVSPVKSTEEPVVNHDIAWLAIVGERQRAPLRA